MRFSLLDEKEKRNSFSRLASPAKILNRLKKTFFLLKIFSHQIGYI